MYEPGLEGRVLGNSVVVHRLASMARHSSTVLTFTAESVFLLHFMKRLKTPLNRPFRQTQ